jgi:hypothetical protein
LPAASNGWRNSSYAVKKEKQNIYIYISLAETLIPKAGGLSYKTALSEKNSIFTITEL